MTFLFLLSQTRGPNPRAKDLMSSPQLTGTSHCQYQLFSFFIFTTNVLINFFAWREIMTRLMTVICVALVLFCGINQASAAVPFTAANIIDGNGPATGDPAPYGQANNTSDAGWIWATSNFFTADFGAPTAVSGIRIYSVYSGGGRGANWSVSKSDDGSSWTSAGDFEFLTEAGVGVNDAGDPEAAGNGFGGWYDYPVTGGAARHLKLEQTGVTVAHAPRVGEIQFVPEPSTFVIATLGLLSLVGLARRRGR